MKPRTGRRLIRSPERPTMDSPGRAAELTAAAIGVVVRCSAVQTRRGSTVGVHRHCAGASGRDLQGFEARAGKPISSQQSGERAGSRLARTLSVPVRVFTHPAQRAHGHMTDRTGREGRYQPESRRSGGIWALWVKRSVKPSAQPTLVRTQHLPPPAEMARELGFPRLRGPSCVVSSCVITGQETPPCGSGYGHMADGIGAGVPLGNTIRSGDLRVLGGQAA